MSQPPHPPALPSSRGRALRILLVASLSLNALGLGLFALRTARKGGVDYLLERLDLKDAKPDLLPFQEEWRSNYRALPNTEGEIVFLGDSIIALGPWAEFYSPIKNRGIGGDTTAGVLDRLDEITEGRPSKVFLLIGTNCLAGDIPVAQVVRNYRKILERIGAESPRTRVYALAVLPVNRQVPRPPLHDNGSIRELNGQLRQLAGEFANVRFIDATPSLSDEQGNLRRDLTPDGLHLNFEAYLILARLLEPYVVEDVAPPPSTAPNPRESTNSP